MAEPANTPIPASTPRSASPVHGLKSPISPTKFSTLTITPRVLYIQKQVAPVDVTLRKRCQVIPAHANRDELTEGLKVNKWGEFEAVISTDVVFDAELVALLPTTVKIFVGNGAADALKDKGIVHAAKGQDEIKSLLALLDVKVEQP